MAISSDSWMNLACSQTAGSGGGPSVISRATKIAPSLASDSIKTYSAGFSALHSFSFGIVSDGHVASCERYLNYSGRLLDPRI